MVTEPKLQDKSQNTRLDEQDKSDGGSMDMGLHLGGGGAVVARRQQGGCLERRRGVGTAHRCEVGGGAFSLREFDFVSNVTFSSPRT
jgi:hypothetical protein